MPRRHVTREKWESVFGQLLSLQPSEQDIAAAAIVLPASPLAIPRSAPRSLSAMDLPANDANGSADSQQVDGGSPPNQTKDTYTPTGDRSTVAGGSNLIEIDVNAAENGAADDDDDAIPMLLAPAGPWWETRRDGVAGRVEITVASPERSGAVSPSAPRSPTAATAPTSPAPGTVAGGESSFAYPQLTSAGGGGGLGSMAFMNASTGQFPSNMASSMSFGASMTGGSPRGSMVSQVTPDSFAAGLAAPTRPKAFRVRNRRMKCFLSDASFLKLVGSPSPVSTVMTGGLAAIDVVGAMLRHVRTEYCEALGQARQWLNEAHFQVVLANPDGTPDEDMRIVLSGDRAVDSEFVLVVPRPEYAGCAFASLRPPEHPNVRRSGEAAFEIVVRHEPDLAAENASLESPGGSHRIRHYTVRVLGDLLIRQLPEVICRRLFLAGPCHPRAAGSGALSARSGTATGVPLEEQTLAMNLNGHDVPLAQCPRFSFSGTGSGAPPLGSLTVQQLARAGVKALSMSTYHRPALRLRLDNGRDKGSGNSFNSTGAGSGGSSFEKSADAAGNAADVWRVTHMDDIEALAYRSYVVRKRNERKVWQVRLFSVDKDFIYNQMVDDHSSTKRPMRRIVDVDSVVVGNDDPKHCVVQYRRGPDVITSGVVRDELEFESSKECKHFATKIRILIRLAQQSATSPGRSNAASSTAKQSVSQRFRNFFR